MAEPDPTAELQRLAKLLKADVLAAAGAAGRKRWHAATAEVRYFQQDEGEGAAFVTRCRVFRTATRRRAFAFPDAGVPHALAIWDILRGNDLYGFLMRLNPDGTGAIDWNDDPECAEDDEWAMAADEDDDPEFEESDAPATQTFNFAGPGR